MDTQRGRKHIPGRAIIADLNTESKFFSYCHLKENLQSQLQEDDCLKLTDFFALPEYQRDKSFKSDAATENLLLALEGKGVIQPYDVDRLTEAFTELKIKSSCSYLVDFYQKTRTKLFYKETIQNLQEKKQEEVEDIKKSLETANIDAKENKAEVQHLQLELQRMKQEQKKTKQLLQQTKDLHQRTALVKNKFKVECDQYKSELESAKQDLLQTKGLLMKATKEKSSISAELEQSQLQKLIKAMSLEESPSGERLAGTTQGKPPEVRRRSDSSLLSAKSGYLQESAIEGEFSMLLVKVAVKLTKNNCVLLATYFNLPEYKTELIREDTGTPGITLLGVMKERNIINMYDVSKLQQALEDIELRGINQSLLKPYQKKIHPLLYEQHKVMQDDS